MEAVMTGGDPRHNLSQLIFGHVPSRAVYAAAELGLADLIANGKTTIEELSTASETHAGALYRLMRYLVSLGLFDDVRGHYSLTAMGRLLQSNVDGSQRPSARMIGRFMPAWIEIMHSLKTSEPGYIKAFGKPIFDHLREDPEVAEIFDAAMTSIHGPETIAMLADYDFGSVHCLADIGGGNASLLTEVLNQYPSMRGKLFDLPDVTARAAAQIDRAGLASRCEAIGGNFFEAVPGGADAYLLRHIIHDWYDPEAIQILTNCRRALGQNGRALVVEMIVSEDNEPSLAKQLDLSMLVLPGGLERTESEYRDLFARSGLTVTGVTSTTSPVSVIEGRSL